MSISESEPLRQFVRAGAGAGKTWNLTRQVVYKALKFRKETGEWPKTVMTTFTRKATQELKERLLTFCLQEEPEAIEFVQSSSFLIITTMHGLFATYLRRYGYSMGLPSQYKVVDGQQGDYWRKKVLKEILLTKEEHSQLLNSFDVRRLLQVLKSYEDLYWYNSYKPAQTNQMEVLCLALAQESSSHLKEVRNQGSHYVQGEKWEDYWSYIKSIINALEVSQSWDSVRTALEKSWGKAAKPRKSKNNPGLPEHIDTPLKKTLEQVKSFIENPEYDPQLWPAMEKLLKDFSALSGEYMKELFSMKLKEAYLEANDLENYALKLMKEHPQTIDQFSKDWDMWFIDEFQDTSPKQIEMMDLFMGKKPCYIVGDPQQSIYLFRGSRSEVFFNKQRSMEEAGELITQLQDNYRSQADVLDFINQFFPFISSSFNTMSPKVDSEGLSQSVVVSHVDENDEDWEIQNILVQVKELLDQGVSPKEICILGRTNDQLNAIQKHLMRAGFPVISHSSANYYSRREI
ncbi:MAG: UvrD-helicase domain-containing protein, partial [Bdellovibrionales bacterium]|nr:UvrD-helicase domain-containing protein [Bdellovibrionales bacterium]NQZ18603.1 UvrD-helicase domain-containing protein [Bdellovibrionales bacterium]